MENQPLNQQQLMYQFQYLRQQRDLFAGQLEIVNVSLSNLYNTRSTVENLKEVKEGEEILLPIGGMVNIKASIKKTDKLLLYVTQDVVIEKDLEGIIEFIDNLITQHSEQLKFLSAQLQNIEMNLQGMSQSLQGELQPQQ